MADQALKDIQGLATPFAEGISNFLGLGKTSATPPTSQTNQNDSQNGGTSSGSTKPSPDTKNTASATEGTPEGNTKLQSLGLSPEEIQKVNSGTMDDMSFKALTDKINTKLKTNNELTTQRSYLISHLYDHPLTPEEQAKLPPEMKDIIAAGPDAVQLQIRVLNDQISGRASTLNSAIQNLTTGYETAQNSAKAGMQEILAYAQSTGQNIDVVAKALAPIYGIELTDKMMANLSSLGGTLLKTNQVSPTTDLANTMVSIPSGSIAFKTNNPFNIKWSPTSGLGGTDSGLAGQDGGTFTRFATPEEGFQAGKDLLTGSAYSNLTLDQAMKKWSNSGYGAEVAPTIDGNKRIADMSDEEINTVMTNMAKRESGATFSTLNMGDVTQVVATTKDPNQAVPALGGLTVNGLKAAVSLYLTQNGKMPSLGLGQNADVKKARLAVVNLAGSIGDPATISAKYKGNTAALNKLITQQVAVTTYENTAKKNLDLFLSTVKPVIDSGSPLLNKPLRSIDEKTLGSTDLAAFNVARQVAVNEISRIIAGNPNMTGVLSDSARKEVENFIPANATIKQIYRIAEVLNQDMANRKSSVDDEISSLTGSISDLTSGSSGGTSYEDYLKAIGQ